MDILNYADIIWCFALPLIMMIGAILLNPRWIPRKVLLYFVIYKAIICISANMWALFSGVASDTIGFYFAGQESADKLRDLFRGASTEYLLDPVFYWIDGIATSRIVSLTGLLLVLTGGSFMAVNLLMCLVGILGQLLLFRYLIERFPRANPIYFYLILFHPSLSLWSSSLLKDTIGIFALGCAFLNLNRCVRRFTFGTFCWVLFSVYLAYLYRPYILLTIFVVGLFMFWDARIDVAPMQIARTNLSKWLYVNFAILASIAGIVYFVRFHAEELTYAQRESDEAYSRLEAGSTFTNVAVTFSASSIFLLPVGVVNTLLRPFLWESTKANQFAAAIENIWMLVIVLRGWFVFLWRVPDNVRRYCRSIMFGGLLVTCLTASGIGLFSSNLGTISRYRIPVIPTFLAGPCVVLAIRSRLRSPGPLLGKLA